VYLSFPCLFFLSSPVAKTYGLIFMIYTLNDADSPMDVPFYGFDRKKLFRVIVLESLVKWKGLVKESQNF